MSRTVHRCLPVALVAVAVIAACGGSSSKSSAPDGGTTTSSGSAATPTTVAAATATDPATATVGPKAALALADLGAGFAGYRKAGGTAPIGTKSCSATVSSAVLTPNDHYYNGAMFKKKGAGYFAYSEVYVFRDEATAQRYAAFRATPAYKQCKVKQDDAATRAARPGNYVTLSPTKYADQSGHIPTMYREYTGTTANGTRVDGGFYDRYTLQRGRVVVVVYVDSALGKNTTESNALAEQTGAVLRALDKALTTRLAGA